MDSGLDRPRLREFANAVAATSTPLRSRPLGSEKTVLTPSRCSASAVRRQPDEDGLAAHVQASVAPGQQGERPVVRDRGDRARAGRRSRGRGSPAPCTGGSVARGAVARARPSAGLAGRASASASRPGFRDPARGLPAGRARPAPCPIGPARGRAGQPLLRRTGARGLQRRSTRAPCAVARVDVERHDGQARRVAGACLEGPVPADLHRDLGKRERREARGGLRQRGKRGRESLDVERIGRARGSAPARWDVSCTSCWASTTVPARRIARRRCGRR